MSRSKVVATPQTLLSSAASARSFVHAASNDDPIFAFFLVEREGVEKALPGEKQKERWWILTVRDGDGRGRIKRMMNCEEPPGERKMEEGVREKGEAKERENWGVED